MSSINKKSSLWLTGRDITILKFLWKYKVATTSLMNFRFFPAAKDRRTHRRLLQLLREQYIGGVCVYRMGYPCWLWTLAKKGFDIIEDSLGDLEERSFKSECPMHDLYAVAALVGGWPKGIPEDIDVITDQQMKCLPDRCLPEWAPVRGERRPDGIWHVFDGDQWLDIALEIEASPKSKSLYEEIAFEYLRMDSINSVLWIVDGASLLSRMCRAFESTLKPNENKHNLVLMSDFEDRGLGALIKKGPNSNEKILNLFGDALTRPQPTWPIGEILKGRKRSVRSLDCAELDPGGISV